MAVAAENYHLKWDSHLSYLNSSVSTLYKNDKFADVVLFCSNSAGSIGGTPVASVTGANVGISAHRFILSSCSQFFSTMFENSSNHSPNGMLYVVLPPDLSFRTIQILVQYMYCGEATVSNDILSEVLKGGELLKIRGLCRTTPSNHQSAASSPTIAANRNHIPSQQSEPYSPPKGTAPAQQPTNSRIMELQFRGLGASVSPNSNSIQTKAAKTLPMPGTISINKDVAIDPDNKPCCDAVVTIPKSSSACNVLDCASCPDEIDKIDFLPNENDEREKIPTRKHITIPDRREGNDGRSSIGISFQESFEHLFSECEAELEEQAPRRLSSPTPNLIIKQEPSDWHSTTGGCGDTNSKDAFSSSPQLTPTSSPRHNAFKPPLQPVTPIKVEICDACDGGNNSDNATEFENVPHLECDTCKRIFDDRQSLVRHISSSHGPQINDTTPSSESTSKEYVPKKRFRLTAAEPRTEHVTLQCDLCSIPFSTPAEWVRHIHSQHTELELAIFNNKKQQQQNSIEINLSRTRRKREATVIRQQKPTAQ